MDDDTGDTMVSPVKEEFGTTTASNPESSTLPDYPGPPRQGREGLRRAIDDLTAAEMGGDSNQHSQSKASSSGDEGRSLNISHWTDDGIDTPYSILHEPSTHGKPDKGKAKATENDWEEKEYIPREEQSDNAFSQEKEPSSHLEIDDKIFVGMVKGEEDDLHPKGRYSRLASSENSPEGDDEALFVGEADFPKYLSPSHQLPEASGSKDPKSSQMPKKRLVPSEKEKTASMALGLQRLLGKDQTGTQPTTDEPKGSANQRSSRQKTHRLSNKELESIWTSSSIILNANANAAMPELPTSAKKDKSKALTEIIDIMTDLTPTEKAAAKSDRQRILEATRKFDHQPSSDGAGGWKVKGLNTSLSHHQVLAVGWMREREKSSTEPVGGLLCDVMGFGKTVTALSTILDGRRLDKYDEKAPTLIVVPSGMIGHWADQINRFFDTDIFGTVQEYRSNSRMSDQNNIKSMEKNDVVLASYEHVRRSYPSPKAPIGLSKEDITRWWKDFFMKNVGVLHRMKWQRIILDEGHVIKNPASATSMAIRGLIGTHKWVVTGTPLHNCIEELYPYFNFIGVPHCTTADDFKHIYCDGEGSSRSKLVETLKSILHRKTHESRLLSRPIIKLPGVVCKEETVELCEAEKILYRKIVLIFLQKVNDNCGPRLKARQWQCILTMFLKLRMFTSHLLTAQDVVQYALHGNTVATLRRLIEEQDTTDNNPSAQIAKILLSAQGDSSVPTAESTLSEDDISPPQPEGDRDKLIREFREFMDQLHNEESWQDCKERHNCPLCGEIPEQAIITSCKHLYCAECFDQLPDEQGLLGKENRLCTKCPTPILEAAYYGVFDRVHPVGYESSVSTGSSVPGKRKRYDKAESSQKSPKPNKASKRVRTSSMFGKSRSQPEDGEDEDVFNVEFVPEDWIPAIGQKTPSAKFTKVREILMKWIEEDKKNKILIFTQFLDTVRLLKSMCEQNGWRSTTLTGKMPPISRDKSIERFRDNSEIKVMISSLKTGGVGLDLSAANKCILLDLWWNEALQEQITNKYQAYGRVYRKGQQRDVEIVKIVAEGTIDDEKMLLLQKEKTENISTVISHPVLHSRAGVEDILGTFGKVTHVEGGGLRVDIDDSEE